LHKVIKQQVLADIKLDMVVILWMVHLVQVMVMIQVIKVDLILWVLFKTAEEYIFTTG
jgi:hypothetical protein